MVYLYSTIKMIHGPINIRLYEQFTADTVTAQITHTTHDFTNHLLKNWPATKDVYIKTVYVVNKNVKVKTKRTGSWPVCAINPTKWKNFA